MKNSVLSETVWYKVKLFCEASTKMILQSSSALVSAGRGSLINLYPEFTRVRPGHQVDSGRHSITQSHWGAGIIHTLDRPKDASLSMDMMYEGAGHDGEDGVGLNGR